MPRRARLIVAGMPHHFVQRGHSCKAVFVEQYDLNKDRPTFSHLQGVYNGDHHLRYFEVCTQA
jgi:putative transposase